MLGKQAGGGDVVGFVIVWSEYRSGGEAEHRAFEVEVEGRAGMTDDEDDFGYRRLVIQALECHRQRGGVPARQETLRAGVGQRRQACAAARARIATLVGT